jgi:hypothetical protein
MICGEAQVAPMLFDDAMLDETLLDDMLLDPEELEAGGVGPESESEWS